MVRGTFSPVRAWRPAAGSRLARTLGRMTKHCRVLPLSPSLAGIVLAGCGAVTQLEQCPEPSFDDAPHLVVQSQADLDHQVRAWVERNCPSARIVVGEETFQLNQALRRLVPLTLANGKRRTVQFTVEFAKP